MVSRRQADPLGRIKARLIVSSVTLLFPVISGCVTEIDRLPDPKKNNTGSIASTKRQETLSFLRVEPLPVGPPGLGLSQAGWLPHNPLPPLIQHGSVGRLVPITGKLVL